MAVSKVILNGNTLMDVTQDTVAADKLLQTYTATKNDGTKVTGTLVPSVQPTLQSKTVSPTTSQQTVSPDAGYDGLSSVTVNAMPSGSASTPATTITANPTISVSSGGLITASVSGSQSVTPTVSAGYVSSGTAGTVTVNGSATQQISDANLIPENIKDGVTIFGVTGTYTGGGGGGYTVTISLTNPTNPSDAGDNYACEIYDLESYDSQNPSAGVGSKIGQIATPTGSTEVTVPTTSYGIYVPFAGISVWQNSKNTTCAGGVSITNFVNWDTAYWFAVTGNGTITISGVNYNDD